MPTQITQSDTNGNVVFRVEGEMLLEDALLLERLIDTEVSIKPIVIDLADLDFLDSDAAEVLRRLQTENDVTLEGTEIFLQSAIDLAERSAKGPA
jgi:anti-anti-sigma factor